MKGGITTLSKKKDKVTLEIIGGNAESVTGSCTKITTNDYIYLFELYHYSNNFSIVFTKKRQIFPPMDISPKQ